MKRKRNEHYYTKLQLKAQQSKMLINVTCDEEM